MSQLFTSQEAENDFIHIWKYIAEDCPENADHFLDYLYDHASKLLLTPKMGVLHPELGDDIRIFPVRNSLLIYRPVAEGIVLIRVLHGSVNYSQLF